MRITQWGEYGVLCSLCLAKQQASENVAVNAAEIAEAHHLDLQYMQQILQRLRRGGIIESTRGPQGGYSLSMPAAKISLGQILRAVEGDTFEIMCEQKPLGAECASPLPNCSLKPIWYRLREHMNGFLDNISLTQILDQAHSTESTTCGNSQKASRLPILSDEQA